METKFTDEQEIILANSTLIVETMARKLAEFDATFHFDLDTVDFEGTLTHVVVIWIEKSPICSLQEAHEISVDLIREYSKLPESVKQVGLDMRYYDPDLASEPNEAVYE